MSRFTTADGCSLEYSVRGEGPLIALTPGGREPGEAIATLADALAKHATVLSWDRRNTGASDIFIEGESEQEVWAQDLADLVLHLGRGPAWIAGGSAGCRVSALSVVRRPEAARGLIVWSASGGDYGCQFLGFSYHVPYIMAAQRAGMAGVAETPFFAERIARNPSNRERLLKLDPDQFIETMKRWNRSFYYSPEQALAGVPNEGLQALKLPTLIFEGGDDIHPASVSLAMASLIPRAKLVSSSWSHADWMDRFCGRVAGSVFDLYPLLAPGILEFIEARA